MTLDDGTVVPFCIGCSKDSPLEGAVPVKASAQRSLYSNCPSSPPNMSRRSFGPSKTQVCSSLGTGRVPPGISFVHRSGWLKDRAQVSLRYVGDRLLPP